MLTNPWRGPIKSIEELMLITPWFEYQCPLNYH